MSHSSPISSPRGPRRVDTMIMWLRPSQPEPHIALVTVVDLGTDQWLLRCKEAHETSSWGLWERGFALVRDEAERVSNLQLLPPSCNKWSLRPKAHTKDRWKMVWNQILLIQFGPDVSNSEVNCMNGGHKDIAKSYFLERVNMILYGTKWILSYMETNVLRILQGGTYVWLSSPKCNHMHP